MFRLSLRARNTRSALPTWISLLADTS